MGSYVVSRAEEGLRLDTVDRGSVLPRGVVADEESFVRHFLATAALKAPMTNEEQARVVEAGRRVSIEEAASRSEYSAGVHESLVAQQTREAQQDMKRFLKDQRRDFSMIDQLQEAMAALSINP